MYTVSVTDINGDIVTQTSFPCVPVNTTADLWEPSTGQIRLDRKTGRVYGSETNPLTSIIIDQNGKVPMGCALAYINAATDPLLGLFDGSSIQDWGYCFAPNQLIKVIIRNEQGGLITIFSEKNVTNQAPSTTITVTGASEVGATLYADAAYYDAEADAEDISQTGTKYRILRYPTLQDAQNGTNGIVSVSEAPTLGNLITYSPIASDENHNLVFEVAPKAQTGSLGGTTWFKSDPTPSISSSSSVFDPSSLGWSILLDTPISSANNSDIQNLNEIQSWGDRSGNQNNAIATNTLYRPLLVLDGEEAADFSQSGAINARLEIANSPTLDSLSGGNMTIYLVIKVNSLSQGDFNIIDTDSTLNSNGLAIEFEAGTSGIDVKIYGDNSIIAFDKFLNALTFGTTHVLKIVWNNGILSFFVDGNIQGAPIPQRNIVGFSGRPFYLDVIRKLDGLFKFFAIKPSILSSSEENNMDSYLAAKF